MDNRVWQKIDSKNICYGGTWDDVQSTIRASVFGVMLELAQDRVKHYRSDLYHDATWLAEQVTCPMQFDWVARESGTFIGDSASSFRLDEWDKSVKYRFELLNEGNAKWVLNIHEAVLIPALVAAHRCEECGQNGAKYVDYKQMWLCSDYCAVVADTRLSERSQGQIIEKFAIEDFALPNVPDSVPNWGTEEVFVGTQEMGDDDCTGFLDNGSLQHDGDTCPTHEVERFCNEDPLPENVVEALVNTDVNPINWTPEKVVEIVKNFATTIHEALPLEDCDVAETAAGCIYHPAPVKTYKAENISVLGDSETFSPFNFRSYTEEEKREIFNANFPTLRNDSTITDTISRDGNRKVINMESILNELREKLDEANTARDEAYDAKNELDDAISEFDNYIDEIDTLISNLDNLPSISVSLDFQVEFES